MSKEKVFYFHNLKHKECLQPKDNSIIGRSDSADITISDDKISSKHLHVTVNEDSVYIKDLATSNGTLLNNVQLKAHQKYEVKAGDQIKIGRITLLISHEVDVIYPEEEIELIDLDKEVNNVFDIEFESGHCQNFDESNFEIGPRKQIRNEKLKIEKQIKEIEKINKKLERKEVFAKKLNDLNETHDLLFQKGPSLKQYYIENQKDWDEVNLKIKNAEKELAALRTKREQASPKMEEYENYLSIKQQRADIIGEIKSLGRENLLEKKKECENSILEFEKNIQDCHDKINQIEVEKERAKRKEKEKIKKKIAELQAKLNETG